MHMGVALCIQTTAAVALPTERESTVPVLRESKDMVGQIDLNHAEGFEIWIPRSALNGQHDSEVAHSEGREESEEAQQQDDVAEGNEEGDQNANGLGDTFVAKENARDEGERRNQDGGALQFIEDVKLRTKGAAHHLQVQSERQNKHGEDLLQVGAQWVRKDNDGS